jgi:hypothetical protein
MKIILEVIKGPDRGKTFVFTEPSTCVAGRGKDVQFKFSEEDPYISKKHFLVEFKPPNVNFRNLDATNTSKINDLYVEEAEITDGDIIEVGFSKVLVVQENDICKVSEKGSLSPDLDIMSKSEIVKRLHNLAKMKPLEAEPFEGCEINFAKPYDRFEYVCPKCEEKTLYAKENGDRIGSHIEHWKIQGCRHAICKIRGAYVELDESEFCKKCSSDVESPKLNISVRFKWALSSHHVFDIRSEDLQLMAEFLEGSDKHILSLELANVLKVREEPLQKYIDRLIVLLNVPLDI